MTKKHFIMLAEALKGKTHDPDLMLEAIVEWCKDMNPNFNADLFEAYLGGFVGPNGGKVR